MSMFSTIKDAIFESVEAKPAATPDIVAALSPSTQDSSASEIPTPSAKTKAALATLPIDVDATLAALVAKNGQSLNYQTSIVDLLKLLGLDSSLSRRKELANDLKYSGNEDDSVAMNSWLHAEVMTKLAAEGGFVPEDWKH